MNKVELPRHPKSEIKDFLKIYEKRPIRNNNYGMKSPHLFWCWYLLKTLNPKYIIESGIYRGQGTWIMRQACPEAKIFSLDPILERIEYVDSKVMYFRDDFNDISWENYLDPLNTLCFFDDHQNAYLRLQQMYWMNFKICMFEDNYPTGQGDCYSMKKVYAESGLIIDGKEIIKPNSAHKMWLEKNVKKYFECPPLWRTSRTRWGDEWNDIDYPTLPALLKNVTDKQFEIIKEEAQSYTWICYVELK